MQCINIHFNLRCVAFSDSNYLLELRDEIFNDTNGFFNLRKAIATLELMHVFLDTSKPNH